MLFKISLSKSGCCTLYCDRHKVIRVFPKTAQQVDAVRTLEDNLHFGVRIYVVVCFFLNEFIGCFKCTELCVVYSCWTLYTVNRKKHTKMFLIYSLQNLTDCDKIWYILSRVNLSYRNLNIFRLTWIVSLPYLVKLSIRVLQVNSS